MGPILIFDKSTLQSLNVDESVWLDHFFTSNITPLFFVETLADLEKEMTRGRTPEEVVGNLASKTPVQHGGASMFHGSVCLAELSGHAIPMDGRIVVGQPKKIGAGTGSAVYFEEAAEARALRRWEEHKFLEVEREFAKGWREYLGSMNLSGDAIDLKKIAGWRPYVHSLADAKKWVDAVFELDGRRFVALEGALGLLGISGRTFASIVDRWKRAGRPKLKEFAPYTAHVLNVELFFRVAVAADLISPDRPSNAIDIWYLYYLPFCQVFTSNDNLHEKTVPLFLQEHQRFVKGVDLKKDLNRLDAHYSALPEEERKRGVWRIAKTPPRDGEFLTGQLWDVRTTKWREVPVESAPNPQADEQVLQKFREMMEAKKQAVPARNVNLDEMDQVIIERKVPLHRGKWRILPPEVKGG